jgi:hypothetical protein
METFLVRVWVPSEPQELASGATLQGLAQHVRSGVATAFTESEQLCAWLGAMAAEHRGVDRRTPTVDEGGSRGG